MLCSEAKPLLNLLLDGDLVPKDCALVLSHLDTCNDCKNEWEELELMRGLFAAEKLRALDTRAVMNRVSAALDEESIRQKNLYSRNFFKLAPTVAAMFLLIGVIVFAGVRHSHTSPTHGIASASTLVDVLASSMPLETVSDKSMISTKVGFDIKYLLLSAWKMKRCGIYKTKSGSGIARFDFVSATDDSIKLSCYQGLQGTISKANGELKVLDGKEVVLGTRGQYQFALWTKNGRDYLFVTQIPKVELEEIVRKA